MFSAIGIITLHHQFSQAGHLPQGHMGQRRQLPNWPVWLGFSLPSLKEDHTPLFSLCFSEPKPSPHLSKELGMHTINPSSQVLLPCWPLFKSEFPQLHSHRMVASYPHFPGQLRVATVPNGQTVRINKVILVKKPWVEGQERTRRKDNKRTHSKGNKGGDWDRGQNREPRPWGKKGSWDVPGTGSRPHLWVCCISLCTCTK